MSKRPLEYRQKEDRKRSLKSFGITILIYLVLTGAFWGWSFLFRHELDMNQGPVLIRLGVNDGADRSTPVEPAPIEEPEPKPADTPLPAEKPLAKTPDSASTAGDSQSVPSPVQESAPVVPKPIRGVEAGNNYELNSEGGDIGRSLWVPVYLYMPLPRVIPSVFDGSGGLDSLLNHVEDDATGVYSADENRAILLKYYNKVTRNNTLELKNPVPLDSRPEIWAILERAGYDMAKAEYKTARLLLPVTIYFEVEPAHSSQANKLTELELIKSSGYDDIDEAVLYAFEQSSYYNGEEKAIKGRFTYRFDRGNS